eukprot:687675-Heterocapsa_arctica.AAC.1
MEPGSQAARQPANRSAGRPASRAAPRVSSSDSPEFEGAADVNRKYCSGPGPSNSDESPRPSWPHTLPAQPLRTSQKGVPFLERS